VKTPVATVGALTDPAYMEEVIASGQADVVQLARELMVDPDFPNKVRAGREDDVHRCIRCATCITYAFHNRCLYCALNPKFGTFVDNKFAIPAAKQKTVLVVGGGVGGMQTALTAAERGHKVILCEKSGALGGVLNCERTVPFKSMLVDYLDRQARKVARAGVDVRLNTKVTPEHAKIIAPDAIVAAVGAVPVVPNIPGIGGKNVMGAEEVYANPEAAGKNVVIIGGGLVGVELAIHLGDLGRKVTVVEMMDELNDGGNPIHAIALGVQTKRVGTEFVLSTKAVEINEKGLVAEGPDGRKLFPADTVVYAVGQRPLWDVVETLRTVAPEFHVIGDSRAPRSMFHANREAYYTARDIGSF
jgi:pyruvate/2-oxoglutarate dehydrogenase complex dihydrolipoamide dehydrogenase (E3) component